MIEIIVAALGGGVLTQVFTFIINWQKAEKDDFTTIVDQWQNDNKRLREENQKHLQTQNDLYKKLAEHERKISALNTKLLIMESAYMHIPIPSWLKDLDGTMLALNEAYEDNFLKPLGLCRADYLGKTDFDIWDEDVAKEYQQNDVAVLQSPEKVWFGDERIIINGVDVTKEWKTLKYVRFAGDLEVGIGGMAIPSNKS
jgi:hypothetical protein